VVPQRLQGRGASRLLLEEVRLQVGRNHLAVRKDVLGEPKRDRASTRADLETSAARPNTEAKEMRASPRVERALQAREPDTLLGPRMVVRVTATHRVAPRRGDRRDNAGICPSTRSTSAGRAAGVDAELRRSSSSTATAAR